MRKRSIDDLRTAHLHLAKAVEAQLLGMPEYFQTEKAALDAIYAEVDAVVKARTCVGLRTTTDLAQRAEWAQRTTSALSRAKLYLRATAPQMVREYFPEAQGVAARKIDRLYAVTKALTVSEHFGHAHLGAFRGELEALRAEGEATFGAASVSLTEQKTEVERLNGLKARWEAQYQKIKLLFRGYFHGTANDYGKFFDDKRHARGAQAQGGNGAAVPSSGPAAVGA